MGFSKVVLHHDATPGKSNDCITINLKQYVLRKEDDTETVTLIAWED